MFLHLSVSHSVHRGDLPQCMLGYTHTPCPVHAGIHTPIAQCMLGYTPYPHPHPLSCSVHAGIDMATAADGTHPTGMHSCYNFIFIFSQDFFRKFSVNQTLLTINNINFF